MLNVAFGADAFPSLTVKENLYKAISAPKSKASMTEIFPAEFQRQ